ncbi:MAG: VOC family protein [Bdellovibrio sp.]
MAKFNHVFIAPQDWDETFNFYHEILGWDLGPSWGEKGKEPRGAYLKSKEGMTVVIAEKHETDDNSWTQGFNGHRPTIHLEVENIDKVFEALPKGTHIISSPQDTHWGTRWFLVKDPDNNIIAFNSTAK